MKTSFTSSIQIICIQNEGEDLFQSGVEVPLWRLDGVFNWIAVYHFFVQVLDKGTDRTFTWIYDPTVFQLDF